MMLSVLSMLEGHLEDEEDDHHQPLDDDTPHHTVPLSKAELRKSNKPIMEKRRRARINTCLNELKSLILDAMKKDPARHSKLEKADILEMTVKHLQAVQRQQLALAVAHDPAVLNKFRGGFAECAQEVTRYVSRIEGVDAGVRQRLLQHLGQCVSGLSGMTPLSFTAMAGLPLPLAHLQGSAMPPAPPPPMQQSPGDVNNNQARLLHGLVAARLAAAGDTTGAALLLHGGLSLLARAGGPHAPNQANTQPPPAAPTQGTHTAAPPPPISQPGIPPAQVLQPSIAKVNEGASSSGERPLRPSAFTAVRRTSSPPRAPPPIQNPIRPQDTMGPTQPQQIVAPTARRILTAPEIKHETVISAQVAVQPVNLSIPPPGSREVDIRAPLDFSFKKRPLERPTPTHPTPQHPTISIPTPKHPTSSQSLPTHLTQKNVISTHPTHPTPTHPVATHPALTHTTATHSTLTHPIPTQSHPRPNDPAAINTTLTSSHSSLAHHTSLPHTVSRPTPTISLPGTYDHLSTKASPIHTSKRPLEDPDMAQPPSKIPKTDHPVACSSSIPTNHPTISVALPQQSSSPEASLAPSGSPPQETSHPGPSPKKSPTPPPQHHHPHPPLLPHPVRASPAVSTTPKKEIASEDNTSPDRPTSSAPQDERDMWRPW